LTLAALAALLALCACSVDDRIVSAGEAFSDNLTYGVDNTPRVTPLPAGVATGPQVVDATLTPAPVLAAPGDNLSFVVGWQGGTIASINMSFTVNQYFSIPVPQAGSMTSGVVNIPAQLGEDVCDQLDDICHQIDCFEQVVTAEGVVSVARAQQIVLDCGGGCGGTKLPGDPCDDSAECIPGSVCFNKYCVGQGTLRVSLGFTVDSDFDLHVLTPLGSEIYYSNSSADGGTLDVDQCVSSCLEGPHAENIVFDGTLPTGAYEVWVVNFDGRAAGDFTIEVAGDVSESFSGSLPATAGAESMHFTFSR
jgi:hypothetical protein